MSVKWNHTSTVCLVLLFFGLTSCSSREPWELVYRVTGTLTYEGEPVSDALIVLVPNHSEFPTKVVPRAKTDEDGSFVVGTYRPDDGAPAGDYKVVVTKYSFKESPNGPQRGPNLLPDKYSRKDSSDLEITVDSAPTELTLELKK